MEPRRCVPRDGGQLSGVLTGWGCEPRLLPDLAWVLAHISRVQPNVAGLLSDLARLLAHESRLFSGEPCWTLADVSWVLSNVAVVQPN
jgi:hypothetical protein